MFNKLMGSYIIREKTYNSNVLTSRKKGLYIYIIDQC